MRNPYAAHDDFIRQAGAATRPGQVLTVIVLIAAAYYLIPVSLYLTLPAGLQQAVYDGTGRFGTFWQFAMIGVMCLVLVRITRRVHGRGFWSMVGPYADAWDDLKRVVVYLGGVMIIVTLATPWSVGSGEIEMRDLATWLAVLPFALAVILVQVTAEELLFRGYLQQQLGAWSRSPLIWMVLPSVLFGSVHYWNANSPAEGYVYVFWAALLGMACADLTARSGTLGAAIGLHFTTNIFAVMLVSVDGWQMSGFALFVYPYLDPDIISAQIAENAQAWVYFNIVFLSLNVLIMWLAARIAIRR